MAKNKIVLIWLIAILIIVITLSSVAYWQRGAIHAKLNDLRLIPAPEQFTELYFEDPSALPTQTVAGQPLSFTFGIHNVENATTSYLYVTYFDEPTGYRVDIQTGTIMLAPGASTKVPVSYIFPASNIVGKIVVELIDSQQQIDFLLSNPH